MGATTPKAVITVTEVMPGGEGIGTTTRTAATKAGEITARPIVLPASLIVVGAGDSSGFFFKMVSQRLVFCRLNLKFEPIHKKI
jgi:hypothetical protein